MTFLRRHPVAAAIGALLVVLLAVWAVKLVEVRRSVAESRQFWASPRGDPGGLLYVALGDSAAQGVGASRPDRGYVGLLADSLREATGEPVQVVNLSSSGAEIDDVLTDQVPRLADLQPDLVTVAVGGNDIRSYDAEVFAERAAALTEALPAGTLIADAPYFMHGRWERDAREAADVVTRSAEARDLVVVPLHHELREEGWIAMFTQFSADWFHPNDRGYRVWARAFWTTLVTSPAGERLGVPPGARIGLMPEPARRTDG